MSFPLRLAALVFLLSSAFYAVIALAPHWLRPQVGGLPLSILLGLGIFITAAAVSLFFAFAPFASGRVGPPPSGGPPLGGASSMPSGRKTECGGTSEAREEACHSRGGALPAEAPSAEISSAKAPSADVSPAAPSSAALPPPRDT